MWSWLVNVVPKGLSDPAVWVLAVFGAVIAFWDSPPKWAKFALAVVFIGVGAAGFLSHAHEVRDSNQSEAQHEQDTRDVKGDYRELSGEYKDLKGRFDSLSVKFSAQTDLLKQMASQVLVTGMSRPATSSSSVVRHTTVVTRSNSALPHPTATTQTISIAPNTRELTDAQVSTLRDRLVSLKGHVIGVYADLRDNESGRFAQQFFNLFQSIGIDVKKMVGEVLMSVEPPPMSVVLYTSFPPNVQNIEVQDALTLRGALVAAGLLDSDSKITTYRNGVDGTSNEVRLLLGPQSSQ